MTFTPEESREIAESMLGWEYEENVEYMEERVDLELGWRTPTGGFYLEELGLPDFSQPEWTGAMLEAVLPLLKPRIHLAHLRMGIEITRYSTFSDFIGEHENLNRNLFDAWKWLQEQKEASNVRPE